ncbi:hypothetical protein DS6A_38 [Mycobacterium phage DS6A]|uniref:Uncharacterized protein n=1 Tax=Mycobacterium phage DS6A TaxID=45764 RepID=G8I4E8_9CAUD|nr:hypothetical protein DS6A_38 [Mycobacterium phage DS6A]AER47592.1 hypothetical protein DS6A_38 [Mycobacterium phage DS6A]
MNRYQATTPDGNDTATRGTKHEYAAALWFDLLDGEGKRIRSFHRTEELALKAAKSSKPFSNWTANGRPYGVVPATKIG